MQNIVHVIIKFKNTLFYLGMNDYCLNHEVRYLLSIQCINIINIPVYRDNLVGKSLESIQLVITERKNKEKKILLKSIRYFMMIIKILKKRHSASIFQIYKLDQNNSFLYYIDKKLVEIFNRQQHAVIQKILNTS